MNASRYFEDPLVFLELLHDRRRRVQADLADLESRIEAHEAEVCRALRLVRRQGIDRVVYGDSAYSEADGRLHVEHWAQAHELAYQPEFSDGKPWAPDDRVALGPGLGTSPPAGWQPLTADQLYGSEAARAADGSTMGERIGVEQEDRSC